MNLDFLASRSGTNLCSHLSSYLVVEQNVMQAELFHQPACPAQHMCCLQFRNLNFTWFSFCRGATLDLSFSPNHRYSQNFIFFWHVFFLFVSLKMSKGLKILWDMKRSLKYSWTNSVHKPQTCRKAGNLKLCGTWINEEIKPWTSLRSLYPVIEMYRMYRGVFKMQTQLIPILR